jgi:hypothetical protein
MSIIDITSGVTYATVSAAISASSSGDVIDVSAGTYVENFPKITHNLTIEGVGGLASFTTPSSPINGQGILVTDAQVVLKSLELYGASVGDGNGAGIRMESGTLTVIDSYIHNNQDGILANAGPGFVLVSGSEIAYNGAEDGATHNLYIGAVSSFTVENSYIHDALGGNEIKSRAAVTTVTGNRIQDNSADSSYGVDVPQGGNVTITNNVFQKGANTANWIYIHFGGEDDPSYTNSTAAVSGNTFINDMPAGNDPYFFTNTTTNNASPANGDHSAYPATISGNTGYGFSPASSYTGLNPLGIPIYDPFGPPDTYSSNTLLPLSSAPALDTTSLFATDVPEPSSMAAMSPGLVFVMIAAVIARRMRNHCHAVTLNSDQPDESSSSQSSGSLKHSFG